MKHLKQTLSTYVYSHCNICNILIYFCNIYMKHLHTSETSATIKNIRLQHRWRERGRSILDVSVTKATNYMKLSKK
jgi:hypothetical protein